MTKKKFLLGFLICMLMVTNVFSVQGNTSEPPYGKITGMELNLAPNPSFEEGESLPTGWTCYSLYGNGIFRWDSMYAYSGVKSVGILNLTSNSGYLVQLIWETTDFIPVDYKLNSYLFTVWLKYLDVPPPGQYAWVSIQHYNSTYQHLGGQGMGCGYINHEWSKAMMVTSYDEQVKYVKLQLKQQYNQQTPDPLLEIRFDDIYFGVLNTAPNKPTITGETHGRVRTLYDYTIKTVDPNQDKVKYEIDWGDNTTQNTDFYTSGEELNVSHIWGIEKTYIIRVKAIDENDAESEWAILTVTMPLFHNPYFTFLELLLEHFPHAFPILRYLLGYNQ